MVREMTLPATQRSRDGRKKATRAQTWPTSSRCGPHSATRPIEGYRVAIQPFEAIDRWLK